MEELSAPVPGDVFVGPVFISPVVPALDVIVDSPVTGYTPETVCGLADPNETGEDVLSVPNPVNDFVDAVLNSPGGMLSPNLVTSSPVIY